jgi:hypothetical protein
MSDGNSMTGQIINHESKSYKLVKLLGRGKGGYSYLAEIAAEGNAVQGHIDQMLDMCRRLYP